MGSKTNVLELPRTQNLDTKPLLYSHKQIFLNCALLIEENIWIIQIGSFKKHSRPQTLDNFFKFRKSESSKKYRFSIHMINIHVISLVSKLVFFLKMITHPKNVFYLSLIR